MFEMLDLDESGTLSAGEVKELLMHCGEKLSEAEADDLISLLAEEGGNELAEGGGEPVEGGGPAAGVGPAGGCGAQTITMGSFSAGMEHIFETGTPWATDREEVEMQRKASDAESAVAAAAASGGGSGSAAAGAVRKVVAVAAGAAAGSRLFISGFADNFRRSRNSAGTEGSRKSTAGSARKSSASGARKSGADGDTERPMFSFLARGGSLQLPKLVAGFGGSARDSRASRAASGADALPSAAEEGQLPADAAPAREDDDSPAARPRAEPPTPSRPTRLPALDRSGSSSALGGASAVPATEMGPLASTPGTLGPLHSGADPLPTALRSALPPAAMPQEAPTPP